MQLVCAFFALALLISPGYPLMSAAMNTIETYGY
jgi:hypothetical protein